MAPARKDNNPDKLFLGLGVSKSVMFGRPQRSRRIFGILFLCTLLAVLVGTVLWYFRQSNKILAQQLPQDTQLYASLKAPEKSIFLSTLFWIDSSSESEKLAQLYEQIDLFRWGNYSFSRDVLPMLRGTMELAQLASGELIFSASLEDTTTWLKLFDIHEASYFGEIQKIDEQLNGWWWQLVPQNKSWYWYIEDNQLYVLSSDLILEKLVKKSNKSLNTNVNKSSRFSNNIAQIYISSDLSKLASQNPYISTLFSYQDSPFILEARYSDNIIQFNSINENREFIKQKDEIDIRYNTSNYNIYNIGLSDTGFSLYSSDIESAYSAIISGNIVRLGKTARTMSDLLSKLYNVDLPSYITSLQNAQLRLFYGSLQENDTEISEWLVSIDSSNDEILKHIAKVLFSIEHPKIIEQTLLDGTTMSELTADPEGLEFEPTFKTYIDKEIEFSMLRGTGEKSAYIVGTVPKQGIILTNSEALLERTILNPSPLDTVTCIGEHEIISYFLISGKMLSSNLQLSEIVNHIEIGESKSGSIHGCLEFTKN
jgi:hypothetical protein